MDSSTTWWAIRHPRTGAVFGWHADARRLLSESDLDLVAEAVARAKDHEHHQQWKAAWFHWLRDAASRDRAAERAVGAWLSGDRVALETALSELSDVVFPDEADDTPEPAPAAAADRLGNIAVCAGNEAEARGRFEQALGLYVRIHDRLAMGWTHRRLARLAHADPPLRERHLTAIRAAWLGIRRPDLVADLDREFG